MGKKRQFYRLSLRYLTAIVQYLPRL